MTIPRSDSLLRRITPRGWYSIDDRPQASQFEIRLKRGERGLSCYLESECGPDCVLDGFDAFGLVRLPVSDVIELGFEIHRVPDPMDANQRRSGAHVEIVLSNSEGVQIPRDVRVALANLGTANVILRPAGA